MSSLDAELARFEAELAGRPAQLPGPPVRTWTSSCSATPLLSSATSLQHTRKGMSILVQALAGPVTLPAPQQEPGPGVYAGELIF